MGGCLREVVAPEGSNVGILMHVLSLVQCKQVGQGWNWLILPNTDHPSLIFGQAIPELELFLFGCF